MSHHQAVQNQREYIEDKLSTNRPTVEVRLPYTYASDYNSRLGFGYVGYARVIRENKRHVYVEVDLEAYKDLVSDARWYTDEWGCPRWPENMPWIRSAEIALKRLLEVGEPG